MKSKEFVKYIKRLVKEQVTYRKGGFGQKVDGWFLLDELGMIKAVLWGIFSKEGVRYKANNIPDFGIYGIHKICTEYSNNLKNLCAGDILLGNKYKIGVYIGNKQVVVCTNKGVEVINYSSIWDTRLELDFIDYSDVGPEIDEVIENLNVYKVQKGDTLESIADKFNTTVDKIIDDNRETHSNITRSFISTNWKLRI